jgi:heme-degrading monooxygenase HmoA
MATVEVIHFRMAEGADEQEFIREDERVGREYTPNQPGFVGRESAKNDQGDWAVIVHWEDAQSAEASMQKFPNDPTAQRFIELMDSDSFSMIRYEVVLNT